MKKCFSATKKNEKGNAKAIQALKEDRQAFGLILSQTNVSIELALKHPLTKYPLSIASTDGLLRQSNTKSTLRHFLINKVPGAINLDAPKEARWIFDGFSLYHQFKPRETYKEWFKCILLSIMPSEALRPIRIEIVNDSYVERPVKADL